LFGKEFSEALESYASVLEQTLLKHFNSEKLEQALEKIGKLDGAMGNIRGTLFEFLVAEIVRFDLHGGDFVMNKIISIDGNKAEIDIWISKERVGVKAIECKGVKGNSFVDDDDITRFLINRIPKVRRHLREINWSGDNLVFELWTTGKLTEKSIQHIEEVRKAKIG